MKQEEKVVHLALTSRVFLILLQSLSNQIIPDHDAKVFLYPAEKNQTQAEQVINHFLGGFLRWDAQYFMHIAKYGYTYENTLAFFPLLPLSVGFIGDFIATYFVGKRFLDTILLLTYLAFNTFVFKHAAVALHKLTDILFNKKVAYETVVLFCFNPASIFFMAPYSECLFSYLTFQSMLNCLLLYEKYSKPEIIFTVKDLLYLFPIALSTVTRSNGILNIGFLIYTFICIFMKKNKAPKHLFVNNFVMSLKYMFAICMTALDCLLPFILYQYYCYIQFCRAFSTEFPVNVIEHAKKNKFILAGTYEKHKQKWCNTTIPLAYAYVQDHYWNVGFMRYYEMKQWPNFLLATPILTITIYSCLRHLYANIFQRRLFYWLFTMENPKLKKSKLQFLKTDLYQPRLTVYYVHALFLSIFCLFNVHIQVSTRLLCSASPVFYWVCSKYLSLLKMPSKFDTVPELFLRTYFVSFYVAGILLFCNFLPWT